MQALAWTALCLALVTLCFVDKDQGVMGRIAKWTTIILGVVAVVAGTIAAFSNAPPDEIDASLKSMALTLSSPTAQVGDVTFHIKHDGTDPKHKFVVFKTDLAGDKLPVDDKGNVDEGKLTKMDEVEVDKGESRDLKIKLTPGHYVAASNINGDYKAGMHVEFTAVP